MQRQFTHAELLGRLADVAVSTGVNLQPGQDLLVTADLEMAGLVRPVVRRAYQAGARTVTVLYEDGENELARFTHGHDPCFDADRPWLHEALAAQMAGGRTARLRIVGEDPALLAGQDAGKVARAQAAYARARRPVIDVVTGFDTNWSIVACATEAWAKSVFPGDRDPVARLWDAIFAVSRVDASRIDPVAEWAAHNASLHARRTFLNAKDYAALRFTGPGTDLTVGLADGHVWAGGSGVTRHGVTCNPNIPTEEVFTAPHRLKTEGHVTSTKPLSHAGTMIRDIRVRFEEGRIVEAVSSSGQDVFRALVGTDEGASRLGEVALVPHSSPISKTGLVFGETLFDENAASHVAIGQSYAKCMKGGGTSSKEELAARGANASDVHVDWMIGSGDIDVDGITESGQAEPLMRSGEWTEAA